MIHTVCHPFSRISGTLTPSTWAQKIQAMQSIGTKTVLAKSRLKGGGKKLSGTLVNSHGLNSRSRSTSNPKSWNEAVLGRTCEFAASRELLMIRLIEGETLLFHSRSPRSLCVSLSNAPATPGGHPPPPRVHLAQAIDKVRLARYEAFATASVDVKPRSKCTSFIFLMFPMLHLG